MGVVPLKNGLSLGKAGPMNTQSSRRPWYTRRWYQAIVGILVVLVVASFLPPLSPSPLSSNQVRLNKSIDYFAQGYDFSVGLIPETPGSHRFWLYSDNYLAALAISRYDSGNQSTVGFASAIESALGSYASTLPPEATVNQFTALNSTGASFDCTANYTISWSSGGTVLPATGPVSIMTTSSDQSPACASQNYADLLLLQAVYYHRLGNATEAASYYQAAAKDFDGTGFVDLANQGAASGARVYQTYKLALYVYATYCLGEQGRATNLATAENTLLYMQDNSTGGFATSYGASLTSLNAPGVAPTSGTNTETTALAALALELMIHPAGTC